MSLNEIIDSLENLNINNPCTDSEIVNSEQSNSEIHQSLEDYVNNMAQAQFKPEYLNCVPQFDGNPNELNRYLSICESLILSFYDANNPNSFHNVYLLNSLISKLSGNARLVINIQNVNNWNELKATLTRDFADQRDDTCLNRDLVMMRQMPQERPQQFYDRCLNILNLLCSYVDLHEATAESKLVKKNLYNNLALRTFLSGLREPLGTTIRCMKPTDLAAALQFVMQEDNVHYFQNSTNKPFMRPNQPQTRLPMPQQKLTNPNFMTVNTNVNPFKNFNNHTPNNIFRAQNTHQNYFPSQPIPIQPKANQPPQRFFTNSQVFRNPQQNKNVFKPNSNVTNMPKPTPMSISTRNSSNRFQQRPFQHQPFQQQQPQRNFVFEELFNTEVDPETTQQYYEQSALDENDYENFSGNPNFDQNNEHYEEFEYTDPANQDVYTENFQEASTSNNPT